MSMSSSGGQANFSRRPSTRNRNFSESSESSISGSNCINVTSSKQFLCPDDSNSLSDIGSSEKGKRKKRRKNSSESMETQTKKPKISDKLRKFFNHLRSLNKLKSDNRIPFVVLNKLFSDCHLLQPKLITNKVEIVQEKQLKIDQCSESIVNRKNDNKKENYQEKVILKATKDHSKEKKGIKSSEKLCVGINRVSLSSEPQLTSENKVEKKEETSKKLKVTKTCNDSLKEKRISKTLDEIVLEPSRINRSSVSKLAQEKKNNEKEVTLKDSKVNQSTKELLPNINEPIYSSEVKLLREKKIRSIKTTENSLLEIDVATPSLEPKLVHEKKNKNLKTIDLLKEKKNTDIVDEILIEKRITRATEDHLNKNKVDSKVDEPFQKKSTRSSEDQKKVTKTVDSQIKITKNDDHKNNKEDSVIDDLFEKKVTRTTEDKKKLRRTSEDQKKVPKTDTLKSNKVDTKEAVLEKKVILRAEDQKKVTKKVEDQKKITITEDHLKNNKVDTAENKLLEKKVTKTTEDKKKVTKTDNLRSNKVDAVEDELLEKKVTKTTEDKKKVTKTDNLRSNKVDFTIDELSEKKVTKTIEDNKKVTKTEHLRSNKVDAVVDKVVEKRESLKAEDQKKVTRTDDHLKKNIVDPTISETNIKKVTRSDENQKKITKTENNVKNNNVNITVDEIVEKKEILKADCQKKGSRTDEDQKKVTKAVEDIKKVPKTIENSKKVTRSEHLKNHIVDTVVVKISDKKVTPSADDQKKASRTDNHVKNNKSEIAIDELLEKNVTKTAVDQKTTSKPEDQKKISKTEDHLKKNKVDTAVDELLEKKVTRATENQKKVTRIDEGEETSNLISQSKTEDQKKIQKTDNQKNIPKTDDQKKISKTEDQKKIPKTEDHLKKKKVDTAVDELLEKKVTRATENQKKSTRIDEGKETSNLISQSKTEDQKKIPKTEDHLKKNKVDTAVDELLEKKVTRATENQKKSTRIDEGKETSNLISQSKTEDQKKIQKTEDHLKKNKVDTTVDELLEKKVTRATENQKKGTKIEECKETSNLISQSKTEDQKKIQKTEDHLKKNKVDTTVDELLEKKVTRATENQKKGTKIEECKETSNLISQSKTEDQKKIQKTEDHLKKNKVDTKVDELLEKKVTRATENQKKGTKIEECKETSNLISQSKTEDQKKIQKTDDYLKKNKVDLAVDEQLEKKITRATENQKKVTRRDESKDTSNQSRENLERNNELTPSSVNKNSERIVEVKVAKSKQDHSQYKTGQENKVQNAEVRDENNELNSNHGNLEQRSKLRDYRHIKTKLSKENEKEKTKEIINGNTVKNSLLKITQESKENNEISKLKNDPPKFEQNKNNKSDEEKFIDKEKLQLQPEESNKIEELCDDPSSFSLESETIERVKLPSGIRVPSNLDIKVFCELNVQINKEDAEKVLESKVDLQKSEDNCDDKSQQMTCVKVLASDTKKCTEQTQKLELSNSNDEKCTENQTVHTSGEVTLSVDKINNKLPLKLDSAKTHILSNVSNDNSPSASFKSFLPSDKRLQNQNDQINVKHVVDLVLGKTKSVKSLIEKSERKKSVSPLKNIKKSSQILIKDDTKLTQSNEGKKKNLEASIKCTNNKIILEEESKTKDHIVNTINPSLNKITDNNEESSLKTLQCTSNKNIDSENISQDNSKNTTEFIKERSKNCRSSKKSNEYSKNETENDKIINHSGSKNKNQLENLSIEDESILDNEIEIESTSEKVIKKTEYHVYKKQTETKTKESEIEINAETTEKNIDCLPKSKENTENQSQIIIKDVDIQSNNEISNVQENIFQIKNSQLLQTKSNKSSIKNHEDSPNDFTSSDKNTILEHEKDDQFELDMIEKNQNIESDIDSNGKLTKIEPKRSRRLSERRGESFDKSDTSNIGNTQNFVKNIIENFGKKFHSPSETANKSRRRSSSDLLEKINQENSLSLLFQNSPEKVSENMNNTPIVVKKRGRPRKIPLDQNQSTSLTSPNIKEHSESNKDVLSLQSEKDSANTNSLMTNYVGDIDTPNSSANSENEFYKNTENNFHQQEQKKSKSLDIDELTRIKNDLIVKNIKKGLESFDKNISKVNITTKNSNIISGMIAKRPRGRPKKIRITVPVPQMNVVPDRQPIIIYPGMKRKVGRPRKNIIICHTTTSTLTPNSLTETTSSMSQNNDLLNISSNSSNITKDTISNVQWNDKTMTKSLSSEHIEKIKDASPRKSRRFSTNETKLVGEAAEKTCYHYKDLSDNLQRNSLDKIDKTDSQSVYSKHNTRKSSFDRSEKSTSSDIFRTSQDKELFEILHNTTKLDNKGHPRNLSQVNLKKAVENTDNLKNDNHKNFGSNLYNDTGKTFAFSNSNTIENNEKISQKEAVNISDDFQINLNLATEFIESQTNAGNFHENSQMCLDSFIASEVNENLAEVDNISDVIEYLIENKKLSSQISASAGEKESHQGADLLKNLISESDISASNLFPQVFEKGTINDKSLEISGINKSSEDSNSKYNGTMEKLKDLPVKISENSKSTKSAENSQILDNLGEVEKSQNLSNDSSFGDSETLLISKNFSDLENEPLGDNENFSQTRRKITLMELKKKCQENLGKKLASNLENLDSTSSRHELLPDELIENTPEHENYPESLCESVDSDENLADRLSRLNNPEVPPLSSFDSSDSGFQVTPDEQRPAEKIVLKCSRYTSYLDMSPDFNCKDCDESFVSNRELKKHMKAQHRGNIVIKIKKTDVNKHEVEPVHKMKNHNENSEDEEENVSLTPASLVDFSPAKVFEDRDDIEIKMKIVKSDIGFKNSHVVKEIKITPKSDRASSTRVPNFSPVTMDLISNSSIPVKRRGRPRKYPIFTEAELIAKRLAAEQGFGPPDITKSNNTPHSGPNKTSKNNAKTNKLTSTSVTTATEIPEEKTNEQDQVISKENNRVLPETEPLLTDSDVSHTDSDHLCDRSSVESEITQAKNEILKSLENVDELVDNCKKRKRSRSQDSLLKEISEFISPIKRPRVTEEEYEDQTNTCDKYQITKELILQMTKIDGSRGENDDLEDIDLLFFNPEVRKARCRVPFDELECSRTRQACSVNTLMHRLKNKGMRKNNLSDISKLPSPEKNAFEEIFQDVQKSSFFENQTRTLALPNVVDENQKAKFLMLKNPNDSTVSTIVAGSSNSLAPTQASMQPQFCILYIPDAMFNSNSNKSKDVTPTATIVNFQPVPDSEIHTKSMTFTPTTPTKITSPGEQIKPFVCATCTKVLDLISRLEASLGMTEEEKSAIKCPYCAKDFQSLFYLEYHVMQEHLKCENEKQCKHSGFKNLRIPNIVAASEFEIYITFALKCRSCYDIFSTVSQVNDHVMVRHKTLVRLKSSLPSPTKSPPGNSLPNFINKSGARNMAFQCPSDCICRIGIRSNTTLTQRQQMIRRCPNAMRYLEKIEPAAYEVYTCILCKTTFLMKDEVVDHLMKMHEVACKFPCITCLTSFRTLQMQEKHECIETTLQDLDKMLTIAILPTNVTGKGGHMKYPLREDSVTEDYDVAMKNAEAHQQGSAINVGNQNGCKRKLSVSFEECSTSMEVKKLKTTNGQTNGPANYRKPRKKRNKLCPKCVKRFSYRKSLFDHIIQDHIMNSEVDDEPKNKAIAVLKQWGKEKSNIHMTQEFSELLDAFAVKDKETWQQVLLMNDDDDEKSSTETVVTNTTPTVKFRGKRGPRRMAECSKCKESFKRPANLQQDNNYQTKDDEVLCGNCYNDGPKTRRQSIVNNSFNQSPVVGESAETLRCKKCPTKSFMSTIDLRNHMLNEHSPLGSDQNECDICKKTFASSRMLEKHKKIHRESVLENSSSKINEENNISKNNIQDGSTSHGKIGKENVTNDSPSKIDSSRRDSSDSSLVSKEPERPLKCSFCDEVCSSKVSLKNHVKREHGCKASICQFCNTLLIDTSEVRHMLDYHIVPSKSNPGPATNLLTGNSLVTDNTNEDVCSQEDVEELIRTLGKHRLQSLMMYHDFEGKCNNAIMRCPICPELFATRESCRFHYVWIHDDTCLLCDETFRSGSSACQHKIDTHTSTASYLWCIQRLVTAIVSTLNLDPDQPSQVLYQVLAMKLDDEMQLEAEIESMIARTAEKGATEEVAEASERFLEEVLSEDQLPDTGNIIEVVIGKEDSEDDLLSLLNLSPTYENRSTNEQPLIPSTGAATLPEEDFESAPVLPTTSTVPPSPLVNVTATTTVSAAATSNATTTSTPPTENYVTSSVCKHILDNNEEQLVLVVTDEDLVAFRDDIDSLAERLSATCDSLTLDEITEILKAYFASANANNSSASTVAESNSCEAEA